MGMVKKRSPAPGSPVARSLAPVVICLALLALLGAAPARASHPGAVPNWPRLLPPMPGTPKGKVGLSFDVCPKGRMRCPLRVVREMRRRWRRLDRRCDHNAVFALTYLRTTQEFVRTIRRPGFFSDRRWVNHEDTVFAELYFRSFDRWRAGRRQRVPAAWRIAFRAASSPNVTGIGDLLLGMNAHINRDLPYTLAHVGLVKPGGASRKRDHDRVNAFLERVVDPVQVELARRYDPAFQVTDAEPSPLDEISALQGVRTWRENAWRNAERLVSASGRAERKRVRRSIEAQAKAMAHVLLAANTVPGYGPLRDAHCRA